MTSRGRILTACVGVLVIGLVGLSITSNVNEDPVPLRGTARQATAPDTAPVGAGPDEVARSHVPTTATEAPGASADEGAAPTTGCLRLEVVAAGSAAPIVGAAVQVGDWRGATDAAGSVEITLPEGRHSLRVESPTEALLPASGWIRIGADAEHALRLELRWRDDLVFWGRLWTGDPPRPVGGAALRVAQNGGQSRTAASAADGSFRVVGDRVSGYVEVAAEGHAPALVAVVPGHETPDRALPVELVPATELALQVQDPAGRGLADVELALRLLSVSIVQPAGLFRAPFEQLVRGRTDSRGRALIAGLPPGVELSPSLSRRGRVLRRFDQPWVLEPGRNERVVELARSGAVRGQVVDQHGVPVAGAPIAAGPRAEALWVRRDDEPPPRTDAEGRFWLRDLPAGDYRVGVVAAPPGPAGVQALPCSRESRAVIVRADEVAEVEITAYRGLEVTGKVVDEHDRPVRRLMLWARADDGDRVVVVRTDEEGRFALRPLIPAEYELEMDTDFDSPYGLVEPLRVRPPCTDLVVRAAIVAATLSGQVVRADGVSAADTWVMLRQRGSARVIGTRADLDGRFRYTGLRRGVWDVVAHDRTGRAGLGEVQIAAAADHDCGALMLESGGTLLLRNRGAATAVTAEVWRGERRVYEDPVQGVLRVTLVPGRWTVRWLVAGQETKRDAISLAADATAVVDVDG